MPVDFEAVAPDDAGLRLPQDTNADASLSSSRRVSTWDSRRGKSPRELTFPEGATLARLERRGLGRHKEPYWSLGQDDGPGGFPAMLHGLETATDRFGGEDFGDWDTEAVDSRTAGDDG